MSTVQRRTQTVQVTCVSKVDRASDHEGISYLGGSGWKWTRAQAVAAIEAGTHAFFTSVGGKTAWLRVRQGRYSKYVQTVSDGQWSNNLLALAECR